MSSEQTPLLAEESSRADSQPSPTQTKAQKRSKIRELTFFVWALVATAALIIIAVWIQHREQTTTPGPATKRNLVFMVSDGMGPASLALTRNYRQHAQHIGPSDVLVLDRHLWGSSRTRSSNSLVTDSAAGATAFSCGRKSYNGAISVLPDGRPCGSVLEAAKRAGYATGLVATTYVTDATPACFAAHVPRREQMDEIALQEIGHGVLGRSVDLILGGGRCFFLPNSTNGGCRADDVDVTKLAQEKYGWSFVDSREAFDALDGGKKATLPLLGLMAPLNVPFELDRRNLNSTYPSLKEMATTALRALERATKDSDKGFFIMIEGSRIDHAGHINDPAAQVHEVLAYDATFDAVLDFIDSTDTETVLVATSDHETGGLALGLQLPGQDFPVYDWYPEVLGRATASCEHLAVALKARVDSEDDRAARSGALRRYINGELIGKGLGIDDATDEELDQLVATASAPELSTSILAGIISRRAHIGWSTHGHTGVDVNVYSSGGPAADAIRGNVENVDVGRFLGRYLDVDVDSVTRDLQNKTSRTDQIAAIMRGSNGGNGVGSRFDGYHVGGL